MLTLLLIVGLTGVTLAVFFYVGSLFLQGYIYTEPSQGLAWQAPAAGGVLMVFLGIWCLLIANTEGASPTDIPYDTIFRFSARSDLLKDPPKEIWAITDTGEKITYVRKREVTGLGHTDSRYFDTVFNRPWPEQGYDSVLLKVDGEEYLFKRAPVTDDAYREFVNDQGWVMKNYETGPDGIPRMFRWGRFLMNIILNFGLFVVLWLCLWVLLRFQWSHAMGLGFVLWLLLTFTVLPMLFNYAAGVAQNNASAARQAGKSSRVITPKISLSFVAVVWAH